MKRGHGKSFSHAERRGGGRGHNKFLGSFYPVA